MSVETSREDGLQAGRKLRREDAPHVRTMSGVKSIYTRHYEKPRFVETSKQPNWGAGLDAHKAGFIEGYFE